MPTIVKLEVSINATGVPSPDVLAGFRVALLREVRDGHLGGIIFDHIEDLPYSAFLCHGGAVVVKEIP